MWKCSHDCAWALPIHHSIERHTEQNNNLKLIKSNEHFLNAANEFWVFETEQFDRNIKWELNNRLPRNFLIFLRLASFTSISWWRICISIFINIERYLEYHYHQLEPFINKKWKLTFDSSRERKKWKLIEKMRYRERHFLYILPCIMFYRSSNLLLVRKHSLGCN